MRLKRRIRLEKSVAKGQAQPMTRSRPGRDLEFGELGLRSYRSTSSSSSTLDTTHSYSNPRHPCVQLWPSDASLRRFSQARDSAFAAAPSGVAPLVPTPRCFERLLLEVQSRGRHTSRVMGEVKEGGISAQAAWHSLGSQGPALDLCVVPLLALPFLTDVSSFMFLCLRLLLRPALPSPS